MLMSPISEGFIVSACSFLDESGIEQGMEVNLNVLGANYSSA